MTRITKERLLEIKEMKHVDGAFELLAFIWTFRRREFLGIMALAEFIIIIGLLTKYTDLIQVIISKLSLLF